MAISVALIAVVAVVALPHLVLRDGEGDGHSDVSSVETDGRHAHELRHNSEGLPSFIMGEFTTRNVKDKDDALDAVVDASGLLEVDEARDRLKFSREDTVGELTFYRFDQCYKDIPVFGRDIVVVVDGTDVPKALSGAIFAGSSIGTTPKIRADELDPKSDVAPYLSSAELVIWPKTNNDGELCWRIETPDHLYLYSAETGELVASFGTVSYEGEMRRGRAKNYGLELDALFEDDLYISEDTSRNIHVFDAMVQEIDHDNNSSPGKRNESDCPLMTDEDNVWDRDDVAKALANVERAHDAYSRFYRNGYDDGNGTLNVFIRVGSDADNVSNACSNTAGWERASSDGKRESVPAFIEFNTQNGISYACTLHEYTHLVQRSICPIKMDVMGESILEAYADVMAITIDEQASWSYDDNCRNIANPLDENTSEGGPHAISYSEGGASGWGNEAHHNSTAISHAAYLMYESGMTFHELRTLWYYSMFLLNQDSDVFTCRSAIEASAVLLGYDDEKVTAIGRAFDEVGIPEEVVETTTIPGRIEHYDGEEEAVDNDPREVAAAFVGIWYDDWSFDGSVEVANDRSVEDRCMALIDESSALYASFGVGDYQKSAYSGLGSVETCVLEEPVVTSEDGNTYRVSLWYTSKQESNVSPGAIDQEKYQFLAQSRRREASWDVTVSGDGKVSSLSLAPRGPYVLSGVVRVHEEDVYGEKISVVSLALEQPVTYLYEYKWTEKAEARDVLLESSQSNSFGEWAGYDGSPVTLECDGLQGAYHDTSFLNVDSIATGDVRLISADGTKRGTEHSTEDVDEVQENGHVPSSDFDGKDYWVVFKEGFRGGRVEASSFSVSDGTPVLVWDKSLTVSGADVEGNVSQFRLNDEGEWEKIGEYGIPTDWALEVLASNVPVVDANGSKIEVPDSHA
ncbi:MAG: M4 family metallopeptidase [Coriobacteriales bacterium]|nr:M4 family metallopeptidase [Coriobacteriales bacterium]